MMKQTQKLILFAILFFCVVSMTGQVYLGGFVGLNSGKLKGDAPDNASYNSSMGFNGGVYLDVQVSKLVTLSFQPGLKRISQPLRHRFGLGQPSR